MTDHLKSDAADLLDAVALSVMSGWGQGSWYFKGPQPCCLDGHLGAVAHEAHLSLAMQDAAADALRVAVGGGIINWNDQPGRTPDEVITLCHTVAEKLRRAR